MSMRHSDSDGSDIFWPGYVDAVTNLVLNLLFLLTIMTVAVFMFALELGRMTKGQPVQNQTKAVKKVEAAAAPKPDLALKRQNEELKREIDRLNRELARQAARETRPVQTPGVTQTVPVTLAVPKPVTSVEKMAADEAEIVVRFAEDAVSFTPAEREKLRETMKPVASGKSVRILVDVPTGFTEAKRMAYYRAMAVRNMLIELKVPKNIINISVREGKSGASASLVRVRHR